LPQIIVETIPVWRRGKAFDHPAKAIAMTEISKEQGVAYMVLERFEKFRLPRMLDIKSRVDRGGKLENADLEFLEQVMTDAPEVQRYIAQVPDLGNLYARAVNLYKEITTKALENEQKS
jgi:hypothetical protein